MEQRVLGVVTARGGSKGIPGKNIKPLAGKPLIVYTVEAAKESGVFDRLILSTDDEKIAAVSREYGCEVPFMRPAELARDDTPHLPVVQHAVRWLEENEDYRPDYVMILQPTSPLRQPRHIREAVQLLGKTGADSVVSVSAVPGHHNPHWQLVVGHEGYLKIFTGESLDQIVRRRQDLPLTYTRNGAIYLFRAGLLFKPQTPSFYGNQVAAYVMDDRYSVNIDSPADWEKAEELLAAYA